MEVVESCILPLVFAPVDHVFQATVRVDVDFPYVAVLETAVFTEHRGASSAFNRGKGSARCLSPAEPFISHHSNLALVEGSCGSSKPRSTAPREPKLVLRAGPRKGTLWQQCWKP